MERRSDIQSQEVDCHVIKFPTEATVQDQSQYSADETQNDASD